MITSNLSRQINVIIYSCLLHRCYSFPHFLPPCGHFYSLIIFLRLNYDYYYYFLNWCSGSLGGRGGCAWVQEEFIGVMIPCNPEALCHLIMPLVSLNYFHLHLEWWLDIVRLLDYSDMRVKNFFNSFITLLFNRCFFISYKQNTHNMDCDGRIYVFFLWM